MFIPSSSSGESPLLILTDAGLPMRMNGIVAGHEVAGARQLVIVAVAGAAARRGHMAQAMRIPASLCVHVPSRLIGTEAKCVIRSGTRNLEGDRNVGRRDREMLLHNAEYR